MMSQSIPHGWSSSLLVSHSSIFSLSNNLTCSASSCVTLTVTVKEDCVWLLFVNNRQVDLSYCKLMQPLLTHQLNSITQLLSLLEGSHICSGICDNKFLPVQQRRKGTFYGKSGIFFSNFKFVFLLIFLSRILYAPMLWHILIHLSQLQLFVTQNVRYCCPI